MNRPGHGPVERAGPPDTRISDRIGTLSSMTTSISPDHVEASSLIAGSGRETIIDVRTPAEFETVHIPGAVNVPLNLLEQHAEALASRLPEDVVLVCQSGVRAGQAKQRLAGAGAGTAKVLDGGIVAYTKAGGDVERGQARWALERQVRLVAGTLVLTGLAIGLRNPKVRFLSAGVGAGLTFSALTDTCAMGRALSALPYNKGPRDPQADEVLAQLPSRS
jgi:rhodanese-related sulfurtransferase